ncbi:MAG UNVERIFIED_CONTAM: aquaporin family protein [Planctomycetaceae bacterium]
MARARHSKHSPWFSPKQPAAFCGATLVWLAWLPHWAATADSRTKLGVFCTSPAIPSPAANLLCEAVGTFALVLITSGISRSSPGIASAPLVGLVVWAIGLSLGGATGYAINPARDFGPRLAHALLPIAGKGDSNWSYAWIPIAGPILGAVAASLLVARSCSRSRRRHCSRAVDFRLRCRLTIATLVYQLVRRRFC